MSNIQYITVFLVFSVIMGLLKFEMSQPRGERQHTYKYNICIHSNFKLVSHEVRLHSYTYTCTHIHVRWKCWNPLASWLVEHMYTHTCIYTQYAYTYTYACNTYSKFEMCQCCVWSTSSADNCTLKLLWRICRHCIYIHIYIYIYIYYKVCDNEHEFKIVRCVNYW